MYFQGWIPPFLSILKTLYLYQIAFDLIENEGDASVLQVLPNDLFFTH